MLYSAIAVALQNISRVPRGQKADLVASLLAGIDVSLICPIVRLLLGELWPPWEEREMRTGPKALIAALTELSEEDVPTLGEGQIEIGTVAEAALRRKGQHPLSKDPLQAISVYKSLRRISRMCGPDSEHRKNAVLRGLFLEASPLEGKYIARTALSNMLAGIGPKTMISAISQAFHCQPLDVQRAYNIMPDLGSIACAAYNKVLNGVKLLPSIPIRPMIIRNGHAVIPGAYLPRYSGLRVQVHKSDEDIFVFTNRLRNITSALNSLSLPLGEIDGDFIIDAELIGFLEERICSQAEMVRYINRRRLSRKSRVSPAILVYDMIYRQSVDLTGLAYIKRHDKLLDAFGGPKVMPFSGVSSVDERCLWERDAVDGFLRQVLAAGGKGLIARNFEAAYFPGVCSDQDFFIGADEKIAAVR
jgi:DNA ligase 1